MQRDTNSLWDLLTSIGHLANRSIRGVGSRVNLTELVRGSILGQRLRELHGRSVIVATRDQFATALALIELDGIARRIVLYPGDLPCTHLPSVIATASIDAIVSDWDASIVSSFGVGCVINCSRSLSISDRERSSERQTEWVLLTSGTTGAPKLTLHTLSSLTGAITSTTESENATVWSTFYDIRRYGGLQIFLRALSNGSSLVLSSSEEATGDFLTRAGSEGVTHISGTPSHWRRALMSPLVHRIAPKYVRLSGEIVDQKILDNLRAAFPNATIVHAFASTEAGVGFEVQDGLAGFPAEIIRTESAGVQIKIEGDSLRIRSKRTASRYLGSDTLATDDGFVDTGDLVELHGDRYYFIGRRDGVINVAGAKVHPEEIESVLNRHPLVQMSIVKARKNPITGAVIVAEIVIKSIKDNDTIFDAAAFKSELIEMCQSVLAPYKVPASIRFLSSLDITTSGKLARISA
jgi:acyl-CoA synthetase (AMP-forming)/AMP-acid ligase II